jgi:hypothetical protein
LSGSSIKINFVASDNGSWKLPGLSSATDDESGILHVDKLDYQTALAKYQPDIVLCAWMPLGIDFTKAIRDCKSTQMYILIGPKDDGTCGDAWKTWGKHDMEEKNHPELLSLNEYREKFHGWSVDIFDYLAGNTSNANNNSRKENTSNTSNIGNLLPLYEVDGFSRFDVEMGVSQLCRYDTLIENNISSTVAFVRRRRTNNSNNTL